MDAVVHGAVGPCVGFGFATDSIDYFFSLDTLSLRPFVTQMFAPSDVIWRGSVPTVMVSRTSPSLRRSLITLLLSSFVTQMSFPSNATPPGAFPTLKLPNTVPSLARSFVMLSLS